MSSHEPAEAEDEYDPTWLAAYHAGDASMAPEQGPIETDHEQPSADDAEPPSAQG